MSPELGLLFVILLAQLAFACALGAVAYVVREMACRRFERLDRQLEDLSERLDFIERRDV